MLTKMYLYNTYKNEKKIIALMHRNLGSGRIGFNSVCGKKKKEAHTRKLKVLNMQLPYSLGKIIPNSTWQ